MNFTLAPNKNDLIEPSSAGKDGITSPLTMEHHRPGLPEPERSTKALGGGVQCE
jgi:hypothetical protein